MQLAITCTGFIGALNFFITDARRPRGYLSRSAIWLVICLACTIEAAAQCNPGPDEVTFFQHSNLQGACATRAVGSYPRSSAIGLTNDSISSIKPGTNAQAFVCEHVFYEGRCELIVSDDNNLGDNAIGHDRISSLKVLPLGGSTSCEPGQEQVAFFKHSNFAGPCEVRGIGDFADSDSIGLENDTISSVKVGAGVQTVLCRDTAFRGDCELITGDASNLGDHNVGHDRVSSAKVQPRGFSECVPNANQVAVFMHSDFLAPCMVKDVGDYADASAIGLNNDSISSVRVGQDVQAVLCRDGAFKGDCQLFSGDDANLGGDRIGHDRVSSLRVQPRGFSECVPNANQVALFTHSNFIGPCVVKDVGIYANAAAVGLDNDSVSSVRVGQVAQVVLCRDIAFKDEFVGGCQLFRADDANLGNNRIGNDSVSSVRVQGFLSVAPPIEVHTDCPPPPDPAVVDIEEANPIVDKDHHDAMLRLLITSIRIPSVTVRLGPNVVLDFSEYDEFDDLIEPGQPLLDFATCVTLTSVSSFDPGEISSPQARSARSRGPLLRFGPHRESIPYFIRIWCQPNDPASFDDGVRISGFRIQGPSLGQQSTGEAAIKIFRCSNIEISNMEIAGWGEAAIRIEDEPGTDQGPAENPSNNPGGRISDPRQVKIFNNFIHHNQYPSKTTCTGTYPQYRCNSHAAGYGVDVTDGAWALIFGNVFDFNRHAIAAQGHSGGYDAIGNLVLKGGGYHGAWLNTYTHIFDVHGTGCRWSGDLCGDAGNRFSYVDNAFQYRNDNAIKIRGRPREFAVIAGNVFPHDGLEDWNDGAINLHTNYNVKIGTGNVAEFDSYGLYGVCDFDGDQIDDLFLPTGASWWYSSAGANHWTYLSSAKERLDQVQIDYFDDDLSCDVVTESGGKWVVSSGGRGPWTSIGEFGRPLSQVAFGQFDPERKDFRPGATRRATHAFWRDPANGQWSVTPLVAADGQPVLAADWQPVQSSSIPMNKLRFGDFTGDGVTDVLAVVDGKWAISESARGPWDNLNQILSDEVSSLFIADLDNNNIDDIIRLKVTISGSNWKITWFVSDDGRSAWRELELNADTFPANNNSLAMRLPLPIVGHTGRFGAAAGEDVLLIDSERKGHFFSDAAEENDAEWTSRFPY